MKKECIPVMGFRHLHIGINFTSKMIYIYIQVEFHLIWNLNPIGIKIANQFVCCYLINPIKGGLKKSSYEQKEKRKKKFMAKRKIRSLGYVRRGFIATYDSRILDLFYTKIQYFGPGSDQLSFLHSINSLFGLRGPGSIPVLDSRQIWSLQISLLMI